MEQTIAQHMLLLINGQLNITPLQRIESGNYKTLLAALQPAQQIDL
ncbi:hypothetical protein OTSANNIE_0580 [Anaplasma phagocytophilum str. Annie]|uniref:Uncharacterized protein n=1 Tax=Anaplasma phagocytophilum (strain HZ) TaxID=212042 RepID=Q2GKY4_ANAPZ|nr:hypothetical protein APH_0360 [Anaplasma phagocytophilum str. HZ]AGR79278.1 hypothetical protein YYU_01725 [Anaplasma phagocytophilum str. HZ2]AGR80526.1 hypothetical protein WSQ_01730 [Anaplasma phagocytophilum str. JM]AGR81784.1 hypothetical protein YYY_01745 [Anaplasma phagocytophilum str. Dog2]KJV83220.1 hypothetical protein APHHGE2_0606 [Anaplasma phagocytophilum str. HGE2]KJV99277.1 hypothetical protein OTSANNIE_0580 [Anaplasma phagocytophilum str. Annie]